MVTWSEEAIAFPQSPDCVHVADLAGFWTMLGKIKNSGPGFRSLGPCCGSWPGPHSCTDRYRAGQPAPLRLCRGERENRRLKFRGSYKVSWVADVFGFGERRIQDARAEPVRRKWLRVLPCPQWVLNGRGALVEVNLWWTRLDDLASRGQSAPVPDPSPRPELESGPESAPPPAESGPESAPPLMDQEPLAGSCKNQDPPAGGPDGPGVCIHHGGEEKSAAPTMRDVRVEDLRDTARLLVLFAMAVRLGLVEDSQTAIHPVRRRRRACSVPSVPETCRAVRHDRPQAPLAPHHPG